MTDQAYETVAVQEVREHPANPRRGNVDAIAESTTANGFVGALIVQRSTGYVLAGNHRLRAAMQLGMTQVPVIYIDVDDERALRILLADNRTSDLGTYSDAELLAVLEGLNENAEGLEGTGWTPEDMAALMETVNPTVGLTDPDEVPPAPKKPKTKLGDLWVLGEHRVLCGDATSATSWGTLMGGGVAQMLWTDPPYGVAYQHKLSTEEAVARNRRRDGKDIENDSLSAADLTPLLREALGRALECMNAGSGVYVSSPTGPELLTFLSVLTELGVFRQMLVWVKDVFVMGRQDYHYRHEGLLYGWKPGGRHTFLGGRSLDTVFEVPRPKRSEEHPTMKPVELVARTIANSSRTGALVLDPFLGSGSTMIAAEQTGRRCYGMDIDPSYVDVAVKRWEDFTGRQAIKEP